METKTTGKNWTLHAHSVPKDKLMFAYSSFFDINNWNNQHNGLGLDYSFYL
jgi:hypothetical protein